MDGRVVLERHCARVEVLKESKKMATVRFIDCHADGSHAGTVRRVYRTSLFPLGEADPKAGDIRHNQSKGQQVFKPALEDIRKPYKDD